MKKLLSFFLGMVLTSFVFAQGDLIYSNDFQDTATALQNWTIFTPQYEPGYYYSWHFGYYSGDGNWWLRANCYDGQNDHQSEQIAITPGIDISGYSNFTLTFDNRMRYGPGPDLEVYYATSYDGDTTQFVTDNWTQFTGVTLDDNDEDYDFANSGNLTFNVSANNLYIAFRYLSNSGEGCVWDVDNIQLYGSTSTDVVAEPVLDLYPNPAVNYIFVNVNSLNNSVTIYNGLGQVVKSLNNVKGEINVSDLPAGFYTVVVKTDKGTESKKFLKR